MKISIVGGGFCGVAAAFYLLNHNPLCKLTIYDPCGIGSGASGIAAGLLHPYAGAHAKLNWKGAEGLNETLLLINAASEMIGSSVADFSGILRIAIHPQQLEDFYNASQQYSLPWYEKCQEIIPGAGSFPGLFIPQGITVDCPRYLEGLWLACQKKGAILEKKAIASLEEIEDSDIAIIAAGAKIPSIQGCEQLPIRPLKGQIIEYQYSKDLEPLKFPLNSQAYLIQTQPDRCLAGATFERSFTTEGPDLETAIRDLRPKLIELFPPLQDAEIVGCRAGLRGTTPNHLPMIQRLGDKIWVIGGMGSKGLLYHALFAKAAVNDIIIERMKSER